MIQWKLLAVKCDVGFSIAQDFFYFQAPLRSLWPVLKTDLKSHFLIIKQISHLATSISKDKMAIPQMAEDMAEVHTGNWQGSEQNE